jgi:putative phosphoribosyl transferase
MSQPDTREVSIAVPGARLAGTLSLPTDAAAAVVFAHGSGSSRHSPRNRYVASILNGAGIATLLMDLLTSEEDAEDAITRRHRFDIELLAERLTWAHEWLAGVPELAGRRSGTFGASTGAAAALVTAARVPDATAAVVSRGGRPDLAGQDLDRVLAPTLLIVGSRDEVVLELNRASYARLAGPRELAVVPGATHLFEEPGTLERVAELARDWFLAWLVTAPEDPGA